MSVPGLVLAVAVPGAEPHERLAGLTLALRAVLTLQSEGASRLTVVVDAAHASLGRDIRADRRVRVPLEVVECPAGVEPLLAGRNAITEPTLVARHHVVASAKCYRALQSTPLAGALAIVCGDAAGFGPLLVGPGFPEALGAEAIDAALVRLVESGRARRIEPGVWMRRVDGPARREAFVLLFDDCRKPVDGIVARRLNRHISIFVSKRLADGPVTPNVATGAAFAIGLAGALAAARGGYGWTLLGATLFQLNSILDGVDGELARVRFQHSRLGQWLDTVLDDVTNVVFWACLAVGAAGLPGGACLALSGWIAAATNLTAACIAYFELLRVGSGDWYALGWDVRGASKRTFGGKVVELAGNVLKKDFFIFLCLCLALAGVLPYATPLFALGGTVTLVSALVRVLRPRRARAPSAVDAGARAPLSVSNSSDRS